MLFLLTLQSPCTLKVQQHKPTLLNGESWRVRSVLPGSLALPTVSTSLVVAEQEVSGAEGASLPDAGGQPQLSFLLSRSPFLPS